MYNRFRHRYDLLIGLSILTISAIIHSIYFSVKYNVGDCIVESNKEVWDQPQICKIKQIGKQKYLLECGSNSTFEDVYKKDEFINKIDSTTEKVDCNKDWL